MNKFEEAIVNIDAHIAKQKPDVSRLAELATKKFYELCDERKELIQNIKMIFEREDADGDFVFSVEDETWRIIDKKKNISIEWKLHGTSDRIILYADLKFIDIASLQDLQDGVQLLEKIKEENIRIKSTLDAYIQKLNVRVERVNHAIQMIESEYEIVD